MAESTVGGNRKRRKTGGRKLGTPNKLTAEIKTAILNAFESVGGESYLERVAKKHPQVFCALLGKVLPLQVTGEGGGALKVSYVVRNG